MLARITSKPSKPSFVQLGYTLSLCEGWRAGGEKKTAPGIYEHVARVRI